MSFKGLNLSIKMVDALLKQGFKAPSKGQIKAISALLRQENLLYKGSTGTGKTHAYLIPLIDSFSYQNSSLEAIIIAPTLELNQQIANFIEPFISDFPALTYNLFNAKNKRMSVSTKNASNTKILISTLENVFSYIESQERKLNVNYLVLDEADIYFAENYFSILEQLVNIIKPRQIVALSATTKNDIKNKLAKLVSGKLTYYEEKNANANNLEHLALNTKFNDDVLAIKAVLNIEKPFLTIIFASKKEKCREIYRALADENYDCLLFTSDASKRERKNLFNTITRENGQIIIASDLFARGIDLKDCDLVISVDLPINSEFYYHRAGRAGRYLKKGKSIVFFNENSLDKINSFINKGIAFKLLNLDIKNLSYKPYRLKKKIKKEDPELTKEIKKIKASYSTKKHEKVKPGYKKKKQQAIEKAKWYYRTRKVKQKLARAKKNG